MTSGDHNVDNTLRLESCELNMLHEELDSAGGPAGSSFQRSFRRWPFRHSNVRMDIRHPNGATTTLHYATRNLSATGISALHSAYVHVGSKCVVHVPLRTRLGVKPCPGRVVRCRYCRGKVHEIGVMFDAPLDLREVLELDPLQGQFATEQVEPARLQGRLLNIEGSPLDREIIALYLRETAVTIASVTSAAAGVRRTDEAFSVILCDAATPDMPGPDAVAALRNAGASCPIVVLSQDARPGTREAFRRQGANAMLLKPLKQPHLLCALADILLNSPAFGDETVRAPRPASDAGSSISPNIEAVTELHSLAHHLKDLLHNGLVDDARACSLEIGALARAMGYPSISEAADNAAAILRGSAHCGDASQTVHHLISLCLRVKGRGSQAAA